MNLSATHSPIAQASSHEQLEQAQLACVEAALEVHRLQEPGLHRVLQFALDLTEAEAALALKGYADRARARLKARREELAALRARR